MNLKGQNVAIEQILVFVAGVSMFLVFIGVFQSYQGSYGELAKKDVLDSVANLLYGELVKVSGLENGTLELAIPRDAAGEEYQIRLSADGLNVSGLLSQEYSFTTVRALDGFQLDGRAASLHGRVTINRR